MALTKCPDCAHQVSTRAKSCPSCGCPVDHGANQPEAPAIPRPDLPVDLSIGRQVVNWSGNAAIEGYCTGDDASAPEGKAHLLVHKRGVQLTADLTTPLKKLHFSQILEIQYVNRSSVQEMEKSVVKRAAVGALLLGPVGALVGGMSGVGTKRESYKGGIVIDYWDADQDSPLRIMLAVNDERAAKKLCARVSKEANKVRA